MNTLQLASLLEMAAKQLRKADEELRKVQIHTDERRIADLLGYKELSVRARKALSRDHGPDFNGRPIVKVSDMVVQSVDDLMCRRKFGGITLLEIGHFLMKNGLVLQDGYPITQNWYREP